MIAYLYTLWARYRAWRTREELIGEQLRLRMETLAKAQETDNEKRILDRNAPRSVARVR